MLLQGETAGAAGQVAKEQARADQGREVQGVVGLTQAAAPAPVLLWGTSSLLRTAPLVITRQRPTAPLVITKEYTGPASVITAATARHTPLPTCCVNADAQQWRCELIDDVTQGCAWGGRRPAQLPQL